MKNKNPDNPDNAKFRACVDSKTVGYGNSITACKKLLTAREIKRIGGYCSSGYIDQWGVEEGHGPDEWTPILQRVVRGDGFAVNAGWYRCD